MSLPNLYSRRKKQLLSPTSDIYIYDNLDEKIRVQILHIVHEVLGECTGDRGYDTKSTRVYAIIAKTMREELGVFNLSKKSNYDDKDELDTWFTSETNIDYLLDYIELTFSTINTYVRNNSSFGKTNSQIDGYIDKLNGRLLEASIGYRFNENIIIRLDSEIIHQEAVLPAINLTYDSEFNNVNKEYLQAHEHYRHGEHEACLVECAKAFESTLKIIGTDLGWDISENDPSRKLVSAAVEKGFLDSYLENGFSSLRLMLESGIPTPRNKVAGHGAGTKPRIVPPELAAYQLHLTASTIVFLISKYRSLKISS